MNFRYDVVPFTFGGEKTIHMGVSEKGEKVIIKFLKRPYTPQDRERFIAEVQRMQQAGVNAGHRVAQLIAWNLDIDPPCYIEEFFPDGNFAEKMSKVFAQGRVYTAKAAAGYCVQILDALHNIHQGGQIHRDLKPANIMVDEKNSRLIINDMGLGRTLARPSSLQTRFFKGTIGYAAPEQEAGGQVDQRADIYAAGVMLHEMLTGQLGAWNHNVYRGNAQLSEILTQMLAPDPRYRYDQAAYCSYDLAVLMPQLR